MQGADGFPVRSNQNRVRQNRNKCRNYGILSRVATGSSANTQHNNNPQQDSHYEASLNTTFENKQLQKKRTFVRECVC